LQELVFPGELAFEVYVKSDFANTMMTLLGKMQKNMMDVYMD
jgi:hypothetical protein